MSESETVAATQREGSLLIRGAEPADHEAIRGVVLGAHARYAGQLAPEVFSRYLADQLDLGTHASYGRLLRSLRQFFRCSLSAIPDGAWPGCPKIGEDRGSGETFVHHGPPKPPASPNPPRKSNTSRSDELMRVRQRLTGLACFGSRAAIHLNQESLVQRATGTLISPASQAAPRWYSRSSPSASGPRRPGMSGLTG